MNSKGSGLVAHLDAVFGPLSLVLALIGLVISLFIGGGASLFIFAALIGGVLIDAWGEDYVSDMVIDRENNIFTLILERPFTDRGPRQLTFPLDSIAHLSHNLRTTFDQKGMITMIDKKGEEQQFRTMPAVLDLAKVNASIEWFRQGPPKHAITHKPAAPKAKVAATKPKTKATTSTQSQATPAQPKAKTTTAKGRTKSTTTKAKPPAAKSKPKSTSQPKAKATATEEKPDSPVTTPEVNAPATKEKPNTTSTRKKATTTSTEEKAKAAKKAVSSARKKKEEQIETPEDNKTDS